MPDLTLTFSKSLFAKTSVFPENGLNILHKTKNPCVISEKFPIS